MSPLEATVNPPDFDDSVNGLHVKIDAARRIWEDLQEASHPYCDESLHRHTLGDDHQQLFVEIVLTHVRELTRSVLNCDITPVKPLRLMLLGTAGTGKTTTVQTALQEISRHLQSLRLPADFVRVAAPTGCAAFNTRFNATTIHRLIYNFRLNSFAELTDTSVSSSNSAEGHSYRLFV